MRFNTKYLKIKLGTILLIQSFCFSLNAQYAPAVGVTGTTAMHQDSSAFVAWASSCELNLGLQDISDGTSGTAFTGTSLSAEGKADGLHVVSLGDGGSAILQFPVSIKNDAGPDFAVFENSFSNDFLELAFVEVSSDGVNFFRFPASSLTQTSVQVATYGLTNPTQINNLAGKYKASYGTPFDLEELKDSVGLDVNAVTHVKVIDVVGSINPLYATYDKDGNVINDPWPTNFSSSGFDLDAVGVINAGPAGVVFPSSKHFVFYPNPVVSSFSLLNTSASGIVDRIELYSINGGFVNVFTSYENMNVSGVASGIYYVKLYVGNDVYTEKISISNE